MGRLCPSGFPMVVRIVASLHLMHESLVSLVSPFWYWGCGFENHLSLSIITVWSVEARGLHAPTVAPSTVSPPPWLSLPVGIRRGYFPGLPNFTGAFIMMSLGDARGQTTPEAVDLKETPSCPVVLSSGSLSRGPTMLTLVNARGPYGTQAPQSRVDNWFIEETMASPYRPTWHPVTGQA